MQGALQRTREVLSHLIGFETISGRPNLELVGYVSDYLGLLGLDVWLSHDDTGQQANLHAFVGPPVDGGVVLNGHTDVVPVEGQNWTYPPFALSENNGRWYGRGSVDMKGYLAAMLAIVPELQKMPLKKPVHVSMCYDEEIGGFGAPVLVADMAKHAPKPAIAIVGEPTLLGIVHGHKGGLELRTKFVGRAAHASDPRKGVNAIFFASRFIAKLEEIARRNSSAPVAESPFDPPWTTISVGTIGGGAACNIVADSCEIVWEVRPVPGDDGRAVLREVQQYAVDNLLPEMRAAAEEADIVTEISADVPALDMSRAGPAIDFLTAVTGSNSTGVVSFGTDAGHFVEGGISTVVCGPGSIGEAHKPDEFIEIDQIASCLDLLRGIGRKLCN